MGRGECRVSWPVESPSGLGHWPITERSDWCGKWSPIQEVATLPLDDEDVEVIYE